MTRYDSILHTGRRSAAAIETNDHGPMTRDAKRFGDAVIKEEKDEGLFRNDAGRSGRSVKSLFPSQRSRRRADIDSTAYDANTPRSKPRSSRADIDSPAYAASTPRSGPRKITNAPTLGNDLVRIQPYSTASWMAKKPRIGTQANKAKFNPHAPLDEPDLPSDIEYTPKNDGSLLRGARPRGRRFNPSISNTGAIHTNAHSEKCRFQMPGIGPTADSGLGFEVCADKGLARSARQSWESIASTFSPGPDENHSPAGDSARSAASLHNKPGAIPPQLRTPMRSIGESLYPSISPASKDIPQIARVQPTAGPIGGTLYASTLPAQTVVRQIERTESAAGPSRSSGSNRVQDTEVIDMSEEPDEEGNCPKCHNSGQVTATEVDEWAQKYESEHRADTPYEGSLHVHYLSGRNAKFETLITKIGVNEHKSIDSLAQTLPSRRQIDQSAAEYRHGSLNEQDAQVFMEQLLVLVDHGYIWGHKYHEAIDEGNTKLGQSAQLCGYQDRQIERLQEAVGSIAERVKVTGEAGVMDVELGLCRAELADVKVERGRYRDKLKEAEGDIAGLSLERDDAEEKYEEKSRISKIRDREIKEARDRATELEEQLLAMRKNLRR